MDLGLTGPTERRRWAEWCRENRVAVAFPADRGSRTLHWASRDFGGVHHRTPRAVFEPQDVAGLAGVVGRLAAHGLSITVRGAAHSCDGQALTNRGVVLSTRRLTGIVGDSGSHVRVLGGTMWLEVVRYLRESGRWPPVLTGNLLTSVGGTISAGGVGGASFRYGLQIHHVNELTVVMPDGAIQTLGPSDELFPWVLAGAGQFGIIAEASLSTIARPPHTCTWTRSCRSASAFCEVATRVKESATFDFLAGRLRYGRRALRRVDVHLGRHVTHPAFDGSAYQDWDEGLRCRIPDVGFPPAAGEGTASPSLVFFLPAPDGMDLLDEVVARLCEAGLGTSLPSGSPLGVLPTDRRMPLAPYPEGDTCLFVALRPAVALKQAFRVRSLLVEAADLVLRGGGKLDLTGIWPGPEYLSLQFGSHLEALLRKKDELDPRRVLNPGLLPRSCSSMRTPPIRRPEVALSPHGPS